MFKSLSDYQFIVKIDKNDIFSRNFIQNIQNIEPIEWVPQIDLLGFKKNLIFFLII